MEQIRKKIREWWMYSYARDWLVAGLLLVVLWFSGLQGYNFALRQAMKSCDSYSMETGRHTKYVNMAWADWSCMVSVNGNWIDRENLREIGK